MDVGTQLPAAGLPIVGGAAVGGEHLKVKFVDAEGLKAADAALDQRLADALATIGGKHQQVLQVAAAAVVAGHDAAAQFTVGQGDETEAGVALQVAGSGLVRVGVA